ncbi:hypothetical protein B0T21DRAFT_73075 [Apiosordaria backusii]|uniref:Secreted protein n=1 Tax=Apiosordaria backusii TaxID=314023 RepID=A0AA40DQX3_9PEZI|nr:hypothetical protein B0T21DRAFT_73075 [Apiosordaria backusii]
MFFFFLLIGVSVTLHHSHIPSLDGNAQGLNIVPFQGFVDSFSLRREAAWQENHRAVVKSDIKFPSNPQFHLNALSFLPVTLDSGKPRTPQFCNRPILLEPSRGCGVRELVSWLRGTLAACWWTPGWVFIRCGELRKSIPEMSSSVKVGGPRLLCFWADGVPRVPPTLPNATERGPHVTLK